jgi:hypothetical protein
MTAGRSAAGPDLGIEELSFALDALRDPVLAEKGEAHRKRAAQSLATLPLRFEANRGQADSEVQFLARGLGYVLLLTPSEAVLRPGPQGAGSEGNALRPEREPPAIVRMRLVGADPRSRLVGEDRLSSSSNYFIGNNRDRWLTGVPHFARVRHERTHPGIDLVYRGHGSQLEFDIEVAPATDPTRFGLEFEGIDRIHLREDGSLVASAGGARLQLHAPMLFQLDGDRRLPVPGRYRIQGERRVGFEVGRYDRSRKLVIDPTLAYSTFLGGSDLDFAHAVAVDRAGQLYVLGRTSSADFPTRLRLAEDAGLFMAYVAKLNPSGSDLVYSTFVGGSHPPEPSNLQFQKMGIAVDDAGCAYITGDTTAPDFPVLNRLQPALGGPRDAFVTKLAPDGASLIYSTFLGGAGEDWGRGLALDSASNLWVVGVTSSPDFPTALPLQAQLRGGRDGFVSKLDPSGSALVFSTYLGGNDAGVNPIGDLAHDVAVDSSGDAYVVGFTDSLNFPVLNAFQPVFAGGTSDAFLAKLRADGSSLDYSTYLGGSSREDALGVAVDASHHAYVTGWTLSGDFPTFSPLQPAPAAGFDAFISKLSPDGASLVYSTYLGGGALDLGFDIEVSASGEAYVAGTTSSADFPLVESLQEVYGGGPGDAFVAKLSADGSALVHSTFLGGGNDENLYFNSTGIDVSSAGSVYVAGSTASSDFPTLAPIQAFGGVADSFVAKIRTGPEIQVSLHQSGGRNFLLVTLANGSSVEREVQVKLWMNWGKGPRSILSGPLRLTLAPGEIRQSGFPALPSSLVFPGTEVGGRLLHPPTGDVLSQSVCTNSPCN